jgi:cysteine-rich repeat protein
MNAWVKYGCLLCCLFVAQARAQSCTTPLVEVGPLGAANGFPQYYVDATRLALEPCLDPVGFCPPLNLPDPTAPVVFPDNFPAAFFYWLADARLTLPGGGRARLTLAVEGSFVHGVVVPGDQFVLGRVRIRADGLVAGAGYTFTHPYAVNVLQADGAGRVDVSNTVGTPGFAGPLGSRVGPFLVWDASSPAPPPGFVGNPDVDHRVTGSPCGTNLFRAEGAGLPGGGIQTDLFSVAGKTIEICGNGFLDAFEECDDGNRLDGDCCSAACRRDPPGTACPAGSVCSDAACDAAGVCRFTGFNMKPCDDGNVCTVTDTCLLGSCAGTPRTCDDANVCTADSCDPATGCVNAPRPGPCDDHNACTTGDTCAGGQCVGTRRNCDDNNVCTDDSCNPATGCVHTPNTAPCDDGDACTTIDVCKGGTCVGSAPPNCDDGNVCTDDSCNPATGCVHTPNTAPCSDFDACTAGDTCSGGRCVGGTARSCDDGNPCTDDSCNPLTGCVYTANAAPCDDLDPCTTGDTCAGGSCTGALLSCDDGNPCTDDACDSRMGCGHTFNTGRCDDGDACTTDDTCTDGTCAGHGRLGCDDGNPCTDDACDPATGCTHTPHAGPCDDGDVCTTGDACEAGACVGKPSPPCPTVASMVEADVTVSLARPTTNSGAYRVLSARGGRFPKQVLLRLHVAGVGSRGVSSVRLRLVAGRRSDSGGRLHLVHDCQWDERTTTWDARPPMDDTVLGEVGPVERGQTIEFDLTRAIDGDGTYCVALESGSRDRVDYRSREAPTGQPALIVETAP